MNVQGKIKESTISFLFNTYVPHPNSCKEQLDDVVNQIAQTIKPEEKIIVVEEKGLFGIPKKVERLEKVTQNRIRRVEDMLSLNGAFPHYDEIFEMYQAINDLRHMLEVKCIAQRSQSNHVLGDRNTLLALERVEQNPYFYETLEESIREILE
jgi:hypothetical protein